MAPPKKPKIVTLSDSDADGDSENEAPMEKAAKNVKSKRKTPAKVAKKSAKETSGSDSHDEDDAITDPEVQKNKFERTRLMHVLEWGAQFWKITRPKYGTTEIFQCKDCQDYNYKMGNKRFDTDHRNERLAITVWLCRKCTLLNIDIANRLLHHADPNYPDNTYKNGKDH